MLVFDYHHRVRYRECDPMGLVYHTHYLDYFEAARTEALREMGLAYRNLELSGIVMPVTEASIQYHRPARYDDVVLIKSKFERHVPETRVRIEYEGWVVDSGQKVVSGSVTLCFFDPEKQRPVRAPQSVRAVFERAIDRSRRVEGERDDAA